ncbi:hypothetical protein KUTeg_003375 [Tegillarca granosa]|uniref:SoHo domain-containing protein n=1 Tax=Tegillarca granosa TaxID=220873 RepID=A0ABQ9FLZ3_TEGGR|nr:hypothetical protein KUTeg_003375 [Tegillarca granosa]
MLDKDREVKKFYPSSHKEIFSPSPKQQKKTPMSRQVVETQVDEPVYEPMIQKTRRQDEPPDLPTSAPPVASSSTSPKPAVWSPSPQRSPITVSSKVTHKEQDELGPSSSPSREINLVKSEYKPIKIITQERPQTEAQQKTVISPKKEDTRTPHSTASGTISSRDTGPESISTTVDYSLFNGDKDKDDLPRLPPTQSPFVTLLQKGREGQIPKGAIYISEKSTVDGDVKHTDTYYAMPTQQETTETQVVEKKPIIYEGIGPTDDKGMPLAFRMNVEEKNQHDWYRQMYKSLHKTEKKEDLYGISELAEKISQEAELNTYKPTYSFPKESPEEIKKEEAKTTASEVEKTNPYKPSYELPSKARETQPPKKKDIVTKTVKARDVDAGYRSEPESAHRMKERAKNVAEAKARWEKKSLDLELPEDLQEFINYLDEWSPPSVRSKIEVYRNQPRSIIDYEPGFSSIAFQETKTSSHNPPIEKPGQFSRYTEGRKRLVSEPINVNQDEHQDPSDLYRQIQQGGEIPIKGLQKPAPEKPKKIKEQSPPPQVPPPPQLSPGQQPITKNQTNYQPITKADTKHLLNANPARNGNAIPSPPTRTHPKKQYKHNRNLVSCRTTRG